MRRLFTLLLLAFALTSVTWAQTMTDDQVVEYVKSARSAGRTQQQITQELMRRGVTKEQVARIQQKYQMTGAGDEGDQAVATLNRTRKMADDTPAGDAGARVATGPSSEAQIYGHNIFNNKRLSFEPNTNVATPANYRLGPGDEVIIDVWGTSETTIRRTITPEGCIHVTNLGPVYLSGKTVKEANAYLRQELSKIYSGISGNDPSTDIKLTLGAIRTIQVNIMGEVAVPGTYRISSFSTVFHALYMAGGVNKIGSLRSIKVLRGGKTFAEVDVYDLLMQGKMVDDVRLQEGDIVMVDTYEALVSIKGKIKRPMYYEMKKSESVATLIKYAGGMLSDSYKKAVTLVRKSGREYQIYNVDDIDFSVFKVDDGDEVTIGAVLDRFENRVEIRGAVYRPGLYQLNGSVGTVKELIKKAEGLCGDAFMNRALLNREHDDLTHETMQIDLRGLMNGTAVDIPLRKNDVLFIPSIHDLTESETLTIHGEVQRPGIYAFTVNMTIEDLVMQAGGLLEAAATTKVQVSRRVKDPNSTSFTTTIGETFTFDLQDGFLLGEGSDKFHLEPFDEVYIRKSPAYFRQQNVSVRGEVLFGGSYALSKKNERLSDLIEKAGGITPDAYVKGARLVRQMTEEEIKRRQDVLRMSNKGADSISVAKLDLSTTYSVGIDLQEALDRPGSDADLVLREGDQLFVPEYINTVKINGAVMYPNTVSFKKGEKLKYYINQAGGFGNRAKKRRVYVVYLNGTVSRVKMSSKALEPGCEIIVPSKERANRMTTQEILSMGTTTASLAAVIASMVNLFK